MRIGIMLRAFDEKGGIGVYTRNITQELLTVDQVNEYVLLYRNPDNLGQFGDRANATELVVSAPNQLVWDQIAIPRIARRQRVDILFHPKFTVPLHAPCKTAMVLHGVDWLLPEQAQYYNRLNVAYMRLVMPWFCRRASVILSVSQLTTENIQRAVRLPPGKVHTTYLAPGRHFHRVEDDATLTRVREKYRLPERFILTLTKPLGDERKNLRGIIEAYRLHHGTTDHKLVIGGEDCEQYRSVYDIPDRDWGADVFFPGWIDQADMPAVYSLSDLYLYPSNLEAFPQPITEAMACGTPIVTSDANGLREITADAALFVDPTDAETIAAAVERILTDESVRADLVARGRRRIRAFNWDECARETLAILEATVHEESRFDSRSRDSSS